MAEPHASTARTWVCRDRPALSSAALLGCAALLSAVGAFRAHALGLPAVPAWLASAWLASVAGVLAAWVREVRVAGDRVSIATGIASANGGGWLTARDVGPVSGVEAVVVTPVHRGPVRVELRVRGLDDATVGSFLLGGRAARSFAERLARAFRVDVIHGTGSRRGAPNR